MSGFTRPCDECGSEEECAPECRCDECRADEPDDFPGWRVWE